MDLWDGHPPENCLCCNDPLPTVEDRAFGLCPACATGECGHQGPPPEPGPATVRVEGDLL